jgi:hypothetical protein
MQKNRRKKVGNRGKETYSDMEAADSSKMPVLTYQSIRRHTAKECVVEE